MTREEALERVSELSCSHQHLRITDCPLCEREVESLVELLMESEKEKEGGE